MESYNLSLVFDAIEEGDDGTYTCYAENDLGKNTQTIVMDVACT